MARYLRNGAGEIVARLPHGGMIGEPKEKIRIEPVETPVPSKEPTPTPTPVETPAEKEPVHS